MGIGTHRSVGYADAPTWIIGARYHSSMREFSKRKALRRELQRPNMPIWLAAIGASNIRKGLRWGMTITRVRPPHPSQLAWNLKPRPAR